MTEETNEKKPINETDENNKGGLSERLYENLEKHVKDTYELHGKCYEILKECYDGEEAIALPIDIEMVAEKLGIEVEYENLNFGANDMIDLNIAQLRYEKDKDGKVNRKIFVDNSISHKRQGPLSNLEKYAVAYELGKTIIGNREQSEDMDVNRANMRSVPYALPKLSARLENFEYEMCAIFLLLPMELFLKAFNSYTEEIKEYPVLMDNWIKHLSEKAEIPNYQLINGYQYIKFCAYEYYKKNLLKNTRTGTDFRKLFK